MIWMPALLRSANARHDAIRAEFIAAELDPDERLIRRRPHRGIAVGIVAFEATLDFVAAGGLAIEADLHARPAAGGDFLDQPRNLMQLSRSDDQIDIRGAFEDKPLIFLGHAADDANDLARISLLGVLEA